MIIPNEWAQRLALIQAHAPEAFIAGGALRDLDHTRSVKDLDIFLSADNIEAAGDDLIEDGFWCVSKTDASYFAADVSVHSTREYYKTGELPVNLIALHHGLELPSGLSRFDLGVCQIAFDGREVFRTGAYLLDSTRTEMTVTRCESVDQMERTLRRFSRLSQKYPRWRLNIPEQFLPFTSGRAFYMP